MPRTRKLLALLALVVSLPVSAQTPFFADDCAPLLDAVADLVRGAQTRCSAFVQMFRGDLPNVRMMLVLGDQGELRALQNGDEPPQALVFPGRIQHFGSEGQMIYWGQWQPGPVRHFEGTTERGPDSMAGAMPYVAGIPATIVFRQDMLGGTVRTPLPTTGTADYGLLGHPRIASRHQGNPDVVTDTDGDGNPIDPGPISNARVRIDFEGGTGQVQLSFSVRGVPAQSRIELRRRNVTSLTFDGVNCGDPMRDSCYSAELRFYGRQGEYAGLLFSVYYQSAMNEPARVAARLNNVAGFGGVALRRQP